MRYQSYLNTAKKIIESFTGAEPLSSYLKKIFAADKKYGSKDRKQIASLCYNYYRLGKALLDIPVEERIIIATFLCEQISSEFIKFHQPDWNDHIAATVSEKLLIINYQLLITEIFPWKDDLSDEIDPHQYAVSFLHQPDLFLRIRPGNKEIVMNKLSAASLSFELIGDDCIALPNSSKIDSVLDLDKVAVVQDHNSQQVLNYIKDHRFEISNPMQAWDCCAASGGKSILLYDILDGNVELVVSDIRESILANLKNRFSVAGIKNYHSFNTELKIPDLQLPTSDYQLIICDAPCTGSGTWSRTPEQLHYFKRQTIDEYATLQKKIVAGVIPCLKKDALFFYITCSVFKKENEDVAEFIKENFHLQLLRMEVLKGYDKKADSMFVAVFKNVQI